MWRRGGGGWGCRLRRLPRSSLGSSNDYDLIWEEEGEETAGTSRREASRAPIVTSSRASHHSARSQLTRQVCVDKALEQAAAVPAAQHVPPPCNFCRGFSVSRKTCLFFVAVTLVLL
jgi:hypothetical protein